MTALPPNAYELIRPLLLNMDIHLIGRSILAKQTPTQIFVDNNENPKALFAQAGHRYILAGDSEIDSFNLGIQKLFTNVIYPRELAAGHEGFALYYDSPAWERRMDALLAGKNTIHADREYYACKKLKQKWQDFLPEGFQLKMVDADLLSTPNLKHLETLKEEMTSERPTVKDFLAKSFGICAIHNNELAGWCLSEYNADGTVAVRSALKPQVITVNAGWQQHLHLHFSNTPFQTALPKSAGTVSSATKRLQRPLSKPASTKSAITSPSSFYSRNKNETLNATLPQ